MSEQERDLVPGWEGGADNDGGALSSQTSPKAEAKNPKKQLDKGAKRNLIIIGGAFGLASLAMAALFVMGGGEGKKDGMPSTAINPGIGGMASSAPSGPLTEDEAERLNRVTQRQADEAKAKGKVFIPSEVPSEVVSAPSPLANAAAAPPPGSNYALSGHAGGGGAVSQQDAERMQRIMQGMQAQMARIVQAHMPPTTSSAARYQDERQQAQPSAQPTSATAQATQSGSSGSQSVEIVPALTLAAAELLSPIDTDKTAFVSAKVASGPMAGATLYGTAEMVRDQGVRVRFNRMLAPNGRSYTINAIAMDVAEAHDLLSANIDRKLFERYVLPFIGAVAGGYLDAIAQVPQQVTVADGGTVVVQQPEVKAKQAAARGLAAGVNQAITEASKTRGTPSASLPAGTPIGVLFLDAVQSGSVAQAPAPVANWVPGAKAATQ